MEINAILSGTSIWQNRAIGRSAGVPPVAAGTEPKGAKGVERPQQDSFEQGQWWKNRAVARPEGAVAGGGACSCRSCPACAVRAYAGMAGGGAAPVGDLAGSRATAGAGNSLARPGGRAEVAESPAVRSGIGPEVVADSAAPVGLVADEAGSSGSGSRSAASGPVAVEAEAASAERSAGEAQTAAVRQLSREEQLEVTRLQQRDTQVKAHEMAHLAAAGPYARGGANFSYASGPDGMKYAVGGEVSIDTSPEPSPDATIRKMRIIRAAAMAPADPSPQDRKVAAQADATIIEARRELEMIRLEQQRTTSRRELDAISLNRSSGQGSDAAPAQHSGPGGPGAEAGVEPEAGYAPPLGRVSPIAARQAAATLAGLSRGAASLHIAA